VKPTAGARPKIARRPVHGVLLLDKDAGASSNTALQRAKRLYRAEKAGHTGTLDPLASGLLPLCFGAATKFAQASLDADKRYLATLRLGVTTTTGDLEGEVVRTVADPRRQGRAAGGLRPFRRRDRAGAADALGAQARRQAALRVRARRHRG
jgi:tRNA pseudouridine55 synthase